ncbi:MAG: YbjN domain-containing protein [Clostridiales bacterium]|nr:YbjN domain-containing protein [Clostridiales bacterium]
MSSIERAFEAFKAICDFMRAANLKYEVPQGKNVVFTTIKGEEFPVTLMISVSEANERVDVYCELPFTVNEEDCLGFAKALNGINDVLPMGKFCYYPQEGICSFENSEYLSGLSGLTEEYGAAIVSGAYSMIQSYVSLLFDLSRGQATAEQIIQSIKQKKEKQ